MKGLYKDIMEDSGKKQKTNIQEYMKNDETLNIDNAKDKTLHSSMLIEAEGSTFEEVYHINKYELNNNFYIYVFKQIFYLQMKIGDQISKEDPKKFNDLN